MRIARPQWSIAGWLKAVMVVATLLWVVREGERTEHVRERLRTPVRNHFHKAPLGEALSHIASIANLSIRLDRQGLKASAITMADPVDFDLSQEISAASSLTLLLRPRGMDYFVGAGGLVITDRKSADFHKPSKQLPVNWSCPLCGSGR